MTLTADEFMRRFLLHVLPEGFQRIRHYGFLGNRCRVAKLAQCRRLCAPSSPSPLVSPLQSDSCGSSIHLTARSFPVCPVCQQGSMLRIDVLAPAPSCQLPVPRDTS
jgi:hypothetical protein